jgi:hypothetical protein
VLKTELDGTGLDWCVDGGDIENALLLLHMQEHINTEHKTRMIRCDDNFKRCR